MHQQNNKTRRLNTERANAFGTAGATTIQELMISTLATSDIVAQVLIEKGLITEDELFHRLWQGRATYEPLVKSDPS